MIQPDLMPAALPMSQPSTSDRSLLTRTGNPVSRAEADLWVAHQIFCDHYRILPLLPTRASIRGGVLVANKRRSLIPNQTADVSPVTAPITQAVQAVYCGPATVSTNLTTTWRTSLEKLTGTDLDLEVRPQPKT